MKLTLAIQQIRSVLRRKHLSLSTEDNYVSWLAQQDVSASTQNQAFCALLFFYREVQKVTLEMEVLHA